MLVAAREPINSVIYRPSGVVVQLLYVSIFSSPKSSLYFLRQLVKKEVPHTKKYNSLKLNHTTIVFVLFACGHSKVRFNGIKKKVPWD